MFFHLLPYGDLLEDAASTCHLGSREKPSPDSQTYQCFDLELPNLQNCDT
jgi:hypothetical protein